MTGADLEDLQQAAPEVYKIRLSLEEGQVLQDGLGQELDGQAEGVVGLWIPPGPVEGVPRQVCCCREQDVGQDLHPQGTPDVERITGHYRPAPATPQLSSFNTEKRSLPKCREYQLVAKCENQTFLTLII